ncbi:hypothetical protein [Pseudonocardia sp. GCM10023141]|uniref:hypothetical protein n=1 Tax=Pseudonocardia sp. GCM10023141 TaxID=3252653 RepID=UPI0036219648
MSVAVEVRTPSDTVIRRPKADEEVYIHEYFGNSNVQQRGPQGFLVDIRTPGYVIKPHFHRVDQFQIAVDGGATIGAHDMDPVSVHYTDSFSPYGPIVVRDSLKFFNFRSAADLGAQWMPGANDKRERKPGRNVVATAILGPEAEPATVRVRNMIDLHDDGLHVFEVSAGPDSVLFPDVAGGGGRFQIVLRGELHMDGEVLPEMSCNFVAPGTALPERKAGPAGLQLLEAQLPGNFIAARPIDAGAGLPGAEN